MDKCGIPGWIRPYSHRRISPKFPLKDQRLAVGSSHTHCAPILSGILPKLFGTERPGAHQAGIDRYTRELTGVPEQVALDALPSRIP